MHKTREKQSAEPARLLTRTETAKRLGVSTSTVRRYEGESVREDAAAQVLGELALDMTRQAATVGILELGEQGLGVA